MHNVLPFLKNMTFSMLSSSYSGIPTILKHRKEPVVEVPFKKQLINS